MIWINTMRKRHALLKRLSDHDSNRSQSRSSDESRSKQSTADSSEPVNKLLIAPFVPPLGFAMVAPGVYRSGHPNHCNFAFLDGLQLKSIMYLCVDNYRPHTFNWAQDRGLKIFHYRIDSYKHPNSPSSEFHDEVMYAEAIKQILDQRNLPILIHCNKGKHRVGTLCALLRIIQGWDKAAVRSEWDKFLGEGAPPGKNMIWSPGLFIIDNHNNNYNHHKSHNWDNTRSLISDQLSIDPLDSALEHDEPSYPVRTSKNHKVKNKVADGLARISEWEYVNEFPIESIQVDSEWIPSWLPIESIEGRFSCLLETLIGSERLN